MKTPADFPEPDRIRISVGTETTARLAYCPVIGRRCGHVDCRSCEHLEVKILEVIPDHCWLCSSCARKAQLVETFWGDGECEECGRESCVLVLSRM